MKRLEGNVTIITGGGKGIGFGLATAFARGSGTEADPYIIANADQMAYFNKLVSGANGYTKQSFENEYVKLISDINFGGEGAPLWYPVGYWKEGEAAAAGGETAVWFVIY